MNYLPEPITRVERYLARIAGNTDVSIPEKPITRKEHYLAAWAEKSTFQDVTVTGNPAVLDNATGKPFKELHIYGRSEQMTTAGAQLLDFSDLIGKTETKNGATYKINEDQSITVSGTPTEYTSFYLKAMSLKAGSYYFLRNSDDKVFVQLISAKVDMNNGFTLDEDTDGIGVYVVFNVESNNTQSFNSTFTPMLNTGSTALPWEPYTGGKPSPSPDYPQEIQSAGDDGNLSVIVKNPDNEQMQSVSFSTPNGLPGIPVTSGGNYTDENGQQWICDEVDLGRGVYVQRIASFMINDKNANDISVTNLYTHVAVAVNARIRTPEKTIASSATVSTRNLFCEALPWIADAWSSTVNSMGFVENGMVDFTVENSYLGLNAASTDNERKAALVKYFTDKPCQIVYRIATPIETPLTASEIAAYKSLRTYKGTTIVETEDKAGISVTYTKFKERSM